MIWKIIVFSKYNPYDERLKQEIKDLGIEKDFKVKKRKIYFIELDCSFKDIERITQLLLIDPVIEDYRIEKNLFRNPPKFNQLTITFRKGVEDPPALSCKKAISFLGFKDCEVRTAFEYEFEGLTEEEIKFIAPKLLYNPLIEEVMDYEVYKDLKSIKDLTQLSYEFKRIEIDLLKASEKELENISFKRCLSLSLEEMKVIQEYFRKKGRNPTDCELETIAVLWSEHCAHKTLKGKIDYKEMDEEGNIIKEEKIENLLKNTIMKATFEINHPDCVSVFCDNSGIVKFNKNYDVCLKVETHNHPSSLEPYGGASTGVGGVIRDILGTGQGAKPIASLDVFCFSPWKISYKDLPKGILHPKRIMKGVVSGVRDYGNKMGIPTVCGSVIFDERFLGNPLVYCGTVGLIEKNKAFKKINKDDLIILCGARTGKDGIHGATFSSQELKEETIELTQAVQIGNPIEEKKLTEAIIKATQENLINALTDCGAGGLSSAVTELTKEKGAEVWLDKVPLKYKGLSYTEIWISESQERMILIVSPQNLERLKRIFSEEEAEFTVIGRVRDDKKILLYYEDNLVGELDCSFLFSLPLSEKKAIWIKKKEKDVKLKEKDNYNQEIKMLFSSPNIASKEWIIHQYDHEVQAQSVNKPYLSDAAVLRPDLESKECIAIGVGINPFYSDIDPYWMAASSIDEAIRNVICVGADFEKIFLLDNFSWGAPSPHNLGALVRACLSCYDFSKEFLTPFISGKDSLNNEYIIEGKRIVIPHTLLITALSVIDDWRKVIPNYFLHQENLVYIVGVTKNEMGASEYFRMKKIKEGYVPRVEKDAKKIFKQLSEAIREGLVVSCHDCSEGGLAVAICEMCLVNSLGVTVFLDEVPSDNLLSYEILFSESPTRFIVEVKKENKDKFEKYMEGIPLGLIGCISKSDSVSFWFKGKEIVNLKIEEIKRVKKEVFAEFYYEA